MGHSGSACNNAPLQYVRLNEMPEMERANTKRGLRILSSSSLSCACPAQRTSPLVATKHRLMLHALESLEPRVTGWETRRGTRIEQQVCDCLCYSHRDSVISLVAPVTTCFWRSSSSRGEKTISSCSYAIGSRASVPQSRLVSFMWSGMLDIIASHKDKGISCFRQQPALP